MEQTAFITPDDLKKCRIMTGTIIEAEPFPEARKAAYRLRIDFGQAGIKSSSAQITAKYQPEDLIGKQILAVVNLPPKKIAGFISECLVLGLETGNGDVILLVPDAAASNGLLVT
jgi:tRNA-binding protein